MRDFDYAFTPIKLLTPEMVQMLARLHEYKGRQDILLQFQKEHTRIPAYITTHKDPAYQETYRLICNNYKMISPSPREFLQIHRKLVNTAGHEPIRRARTSGDDDTFDPAILLKNRKEHPEAGDASIQGISSQETTPEESSEGISGFRKTGDLMTRYSHIRNAQLQRSGLRFRDTLQMAHSNGIERLSAEEETDPEEAVEALCEEFTLAWEEDLIDKLILIPMFLVDLTCIRPFEQENEAFCQLIALLLLLRAGYQVGRSVSLEELIDKSRLTCSNVLQASCEGWEEEANNYSMFTAFFLTVLSQAFEISEEWTTGFGMKRQKKPDRIRELIDARDGRITKKEILETFPDISKVTVERALTDLVKKGYITKVGAGPSTGYVKTAVT